MNNAAKQSVVRMRDFPAREVGTRISKALSSAAGQLADRAQHWSTKAKASANRTNGFVRANPWQAAGAVVLLGVVTGVLVSRRARVRRRAAHQSEAGISELAGG